MAESSSQPNTFVTTIDKNLANQMLRDLRDQEFEITIPPYTLFSAKKKGLTCVLYQSGKLVVQGKNKDEFIEFYLEPKILKSFSYTNPLVGVDLTPHIGIDESGKGDFFGPLCIAGVYAGGDQIAALKNMGIQDSKKIGDRAILELAKKIKENFVYHIVKINPAKYNQIYYNFNNLNRLLAWGHATTIELLIEKSGCQKVIIDQFADESVVLTALKRKNLQIELTQRHRAEEDLVVAAASILARATFLEGLKQLGEEIGIELPKGASTPTVTAGKKIFNKLGREGLEKTCKMHFKVLNLIL